MSQLFTRDERLILMDPANGPLLRKVTQWDRLVAIFTDPDLIAIVLFCRAGRVTDGRANSRCSRMGRGHRNGPARPLTNGAALRSASERGAVLVASARGRRRLRSVCSDLRLCGWKPHTDVVDDPH